MIREVFKYSLTYYFIAFLLAAFFIKPDVTLLMRRVNAMQINIWSRAACSPDDVVPNDINGRTKGPRH
jgi:hypothetical protein